MAGTMAANINQIGRGCFKPIGLINQLRFSGAVGDTPSGTSSFYQQITVTINLFNDNLQWPLLVWYSMT